MIHYFILLFLTSPALSLLGIIGLPYFPNEKLALILILFLIIKNNIKINVSDFIVFATIGIIMLLITIFNGLATFTQSEINTFYFFIAIIFYVTYFKVYWKNVLAILSKIVLLQIVVSLVQQVMMNIGYTDFAMIFNNYPAQETYIYPHSYGDFFRTSGLFNESSQYSVLLLLFIVLYLENILEKNTMVKFVFIAALIDLFINESITAFVILFLYMLYKVYLTKNNLYLKIIFPLLLISLAVVFSNIFSNIQEKFIGTFMMTSSSYTRMSAALNKINEVFEKAPLLGLGLSWDDVSWDIVSIYFYSYGFIGVFMILIFILYIIIRTRNIVIFIFSLFLFTNASLLVTMNILLIGFAYSLSKFHERRLS